MRLKYYSFILAAYSGVVPEPKDALEQGQRLLQK
jgi:hypothetical protein